MANFTPTLAPIHEKSPFRFWCQKVLPTVYDDSLSYYELLTKVVYYLNENTQDLETVNSNVEALYNSYVELQNYVNNYFDQNFPELVEQKLDEMVEDGTFDAMLHAIVDPYFELKSEEIDDAIEAQNYDINLLTARLDNFVNSHAGITTETVLWSGNAYYPEQVLTLSDDYRDYPYIDVHYSVSYRSGTVEVKRFNTNKLYMDDIEICRSLPYESNSHDCLMIQHIVISHVNEDESDPSSEVDYTKLKVSVANAWDWDGTTTVLPSIDDSYEQASELYPVTIAGVVKKIVGIKDTQSDTEVIDARTGYNGTVYDTLGQAIRTQVQALENQIIYMEQGTLMIRINGTPYPVSKIESTTVNGVQGWNWTIEDGSLDGLTFFFADGVGLNTIKTQIESEMGAVVDVDFAMESGSALDPYTYGEISVEYRDGTVNRMNVGIIDPTTNKLYADSVPTKSTVVSGNKEPINAIALINYAGKKIPKTTVSGTSVTQQLTENTFYVFGEVTALTLTFATPADANIMNEYHFRFTSGATPTVLTLPAGVTMNETLTVEANKTYEVSIIDNYGVWCAW